MRGISYEWSHTTLVLGLCSASRFQGPSARSWHLLHPSLAEHCPAERPDRRCQPPAIHQRWTPGCSPLSVIVKDSDDGLFSASWCTRLGGGWLEGILCLLSEPQRAPSSKMYLLWTVATQPQAGTPCTHSQLMPSLKPRAELWALLCASRVAGAGRGHGDHSDHGGGGASRDGWPLGPLRWGLQPPK